METIALVGVVLLAVLVGLAIPLMFQCRATLKSAQLFLETTSARTDRAFTELTQLSARVNHVLGEVEGNLPRIRRVLEATDGVVEAIDKVRGSLHVFGAIGPAAFAVAKSLFSSFVASRMPPSEPSPADEEASAPLRVAQQVAAP